MATSETIGGRVVSKTAVLPDTDLPGAVARARYVRITPMKARRVVDLIRGMSADQALAVLQFAPQSAGEQVRKVLASAVANAENNDRLDREDLVITEAFVDEGPTLKRFRPRAQGRAYRIRKRTSHITVVVTAVPNESKPKPAKKTAKKVARAADSASAKPAKKASAKPAKKATAEADPAKAAEVTASTEDTSAADTEATGTAKRRAR